MKAIITKYLGPTNFRGSRIKASDGDRNQITISYDDALSSDDAHDAAALALCRKMGWTRYNLMRGGTPTGNVYTFDDASNCLDITADHMQTPAGKCPVCGHYGGDCTGTLKA